MAAPETLLNYFDVESFFRDESINTFHVIEFDGMDYVFHR
jgi:hypothetical protein